MVSTRGIYSISSLSERVRDPSDKMHAEHGILPDQGRDLAEQRGAPGHYVPGRTVRIATDRLESGMQGTRLHRMYHLSLRASAKHMRQPFQ